jgi:hypothetical protein
MEVHDIADLVPPPFLRKMHYCGRDSEYKMHDLRIIVGVNSLELLPMCQECMVARLGMIKLPLFDYL